jgi:hypothetical protein
MYLQGEAEVPGSARGMGMYVCMSEEGRDHHARA